MWQNPPDGFIECPTWGAIESCLDSPGPDLLFELRGTAKGKYNRVGIGPSNSVSDTSTNRDCASWYNRGLKTCINKFAANRTTTSTSYVEINSEIECNFVTWGTGDPSQSDLSWSISGMMNNDTAMDGAAVTAGFDPEPLPQTEETAGVNPGASVGGFPFSVRGSMTGLAEGKHDITLLGKVIAGGTATYFGTVPDTSLEIRIPQ